MGSSQGSNVHGPSWSAGRSASPHVREQQQPGERPHVCAPFHCRRLPQHRTSFSGARSHDREATFVSILPASLCDWRNFCNVSTNIDGIEEEAEQIYIDMTLAHSCHNSVI